MEVISLFRSLRENQIPSLRLSLSAVSSSRLLARLSRFINKYCYGLGVGSAINRYDNSIAIYSSWADKRLYREFDENDIFCNFGSGAFYHQRWRNFDYPGLSSYYKAIQGKEGVDFTAVDLCGPDLRLPFGHSEVALIYCSHTLEHLERASAERFLSECKRVLKPGGVMRLALPNTVSDFKMGALVDLQPNISEETKSRYFVDVAAHVLADSRNKLESAEVKALMREDKFSPSRFVSNAISRGVSDSFAKSNPERHISFWDYDNILSVCRDLEFSYVVPYYRGASSVEPFTNLNVFDTTEPHISFYVELIS